MYDAALILLNNLIENSNGNFKIELIGSSLTITSNKATYTCHPARLSVETLLKAEANRIATEREQYECKFHEVEK